MLSNTTAYASFSVDDIPKAKEFYASTVGLTLTQDESPHALIFAAGNLRFSVYLKENHAPATFTVLNFEVDNIEKTVEELSKKGITFERYNGANGPKTNEQGISKQGPVAMAWFKDPAGNVLGISQGVLK
jgi:predicted enzyme related to lactoylglutathione lyase